MASVLDIQKDHPQLIENAMAILAAEGTLVFSNNFRRFKMDEALLAQYSVENITTKTLDPDFQRNQKIHNCWLIRHREGGSQAPKPAFQKGAKHNPWGAR